MKKILFFLVFLVYACGQVPIETAATPTTTQAAIPIVQTTPIATSVNFLNLQPSQNHVGFIKPTPPAAGQDLDKSIFPDKPIAAGDYVYLPVRVVTSKDGPFTMVVAASLVEKDIEIEIIFNELSEVQRVVCYSDFCQTSFEVDRVDVNFSNDTYEGGLMNSGTIGIIEDELPMSPK